MKTAGRRVNTAKRLVLSDVANLIRQYGCGPVQFAGTDEALYERHLLFDSGVELGAATARDRFEALARSVRDILSQRWLLTEKTYEQRDPKRLYYLSMEFLIGRSLAIELAFRIAIYENVLREVGKAKTFQQVFRSGDRDADSVAKLLIPKITVEKYTPGSETRRAVTTVTGATKVTVRTQLCTRQGRIVWERGSGASVRFMGANLRVTNSLALNIGREMRSPGLDPLLHTLYSPRTASDISAGGDSE